MTAVELMTLRTVLADRRCALLNRLAVTAASDNQVVDAGFLRLLADTHTAITAVDAQMDSVLETELDSEPDAELKEV
jgi:hypothetical protein